MKQVLPIGRRKEDHPQQGFLFRLGLAVKKAPVLAAVLTALVVLSVPTVLVIGAVRQNHRLTVRLCTQNAIIVQVLEDNPRAEGRSRAIAQLKSLNCSPRGGVRK